MNFAKRLFPYCFVICIAQALGGGLANSAGADGKLTIAAISRSASEVTLRVSVRDDAQHPIRGLTASNFSVRVDGSPGRIIRVQPTDNDRPLAAILLVDISKSMSGKPMRRALDSAGRLVDEAGQNDALCLMTFGEAVNLVSDYGSGRDEIARAISDIQPSDQRTLLNSAVLAGARKAEKSPLDRTAVVLFTDGVDQGSKISLGQAIAEAQKASVPFYTVSCGRHPESGTLMRISELTDGAYRNAADDTYSLFQTIRDGLKDEYDVTVSAPLSPGSHGVAVTATIAGQTLSAVKPITVPAPRHPASKSRSRTWWVLGIALLIAAVAAFWLVTRKIRDLEGDQMEAEDKDGAPAPRTWVDAPLPADAARARRTGKVWLQISTGRHAGSRLDLTGQPVLVGRDSRSQLALTSDPAVSRRHAEITLTNTGEFVLRDLGSENGTALNGNDLGEGIVTLRDGDRIAVGGSELVYRDTRPRLANNTRR
ncbi:MAG: VWA domain-containing protein [Armatimonadota bacterium]|nr:VWA domain-containing protein [Armatimonadota bacterium]